MVDYDSARHATEGLESAKRRDEIKLAKTREQLEESRRLYEVLNKELHDELPALYDSRISFLISSLQTLFAAETTFHGEYSRVNAQFADMVDLLAQEAQKGSFHTCPRLLSASHAPHLSHGGMEDGIHQMGMQGQHNYEDVSGKNIESGGMNIVDPSSPQIVTSSSVVVAPNRANNGDVTVINNNLSELSL